MKPASSHSRLTDRATRLSLTINGEAVVTTARTLAVVLADRGLVGARVATAVNGRFVPERERAGTPLEAGDTIEIVSARQGG